MKEEGGPVQGNEEWQVIIGKLPIAALVSEGRIEKVILINRKFTETFGYTIEDMPDVHHWWPLAYPDQAYRRRIADQWNRNLERAIAEKRELDPMEVTVTCRDKSVRHVVVQAYSFGERHMVLFTDQTRIEESRRALERALREKEQLMREMNHRVKNNLHIISSLISLKDEDPGCSGTLGDISRQIDAIRIVHEKLYQSGDTSSINLKEYLQDLLDSVFSIFAGGGVRVENRVPEIRIPSHIAVSIGLVVNEAATNAVKHGFLEGEPALFRAELERVPGRPHRVLYLENSGNPFPDHIRTPEEGGFGLHLMDSLVRHIGGRLELERTPSLRLSVEFPV